MQILKQLVAAALLLSAVQLKAQTPGPLSEEHDFAATALISNNCIVNKDYRRIQSGIVYMNDHEAVFSVNTKRMNNPALVKVDDNANVEWTLPMPNGMMFFAKLGNNIIAFSGDNWDLTDQKSPLGILGQPLKSVTATLINSATGTIISTKQVWEKKSGSFVDPKLITDTHGNFQHLFIRYVFEDRGSSNQFNKATTRESIIGAIDLIDINENLDVTKTLRLNTRTDVLFITCTGNDDGDLFIVGSDNTKTVFADKYLPGATDASTKLEVPCDFHEGVTNTTVANLIPGSENKLLVGLRFEIEKGDSKVATMVVKFDFDEKKAYYHEDHITKDYVKSLGFKGSEDLKYLAAVSYKDKIVTIRVLDGFEVGEFFILSVYDQNMNLQGEGTVSTAIQHANTTSWFPTAYNVVGNKLFLLYPYAKGIPASWVNGTAGAVLVPINLDDIKVDEKDRIMLSKNVDHKLYEVPCEATLWFKTGFIVQNHYLHIASSDQKTLFQKVTY